MENEILKIIVTSILMVGAIIILSIIFMARAIAGRAASRREMQELRKDISEIKNHIEDIREQLADIIIRLD